MGLMDDLTQAVADRTAGMLPDAAKARVAALITVRGVMPDADVYDRVRLARYILTGNDELVLDGLVEPVPEDVEPEYAVELGDQKFTQAQWEAVQRYCDGRDRGEETDKAAAPAPGWVPEHHVMVGHRLSVQDEDGKGVSGWVASWHAAPGGHPFTVFVSGEKPEPEITATQPTPPEVVGTDPELLASIQHAEPAPDSGEGWSGRRG